MILARTRNLAMLLMFVAVQIVVVGCATYRQAVLPGAVSNESTIAVEQIVVEGSHVKLQLHSGETYEGVVEKITAKKIEIGGLANYGLSSLDIDISDIECISVRNQEDGQIERSWFVGMLAAAIIAIAVSLPITMGS